MLPLFSVPRLTRLCIAACLAMVGVVLMVAILAVMEGSAGEAKIMIPSAAVGAFLSGLLFAGFFGRSSDGKTGVVPALIGAVLATALGSFLGGMTWGVLGTIVDGVPGDLNPIMFLLQIGFFCFLVVMAIAPATQPFLIALWLVLMILVQIAALFLRRLQT